MKQNSGSSIFSGIVNMMGERVIVHRATRAAGYEQARRQPRGRERDVNAPIELGAYRPENREQIFLKAIVANQSDNTRKRESGEVREANLRIKAYQQIFATDNATADYADIVEARGEFWKVRSVNYDPRGGLYQASLGKLSDDECVDIGVDRVIRKHAT